MAACVADGPTAPTDDGVTGTWTGVLANLTADGGVGLDPGHSVTFTLAERPDTIRGLFLSTLLEDQEVGGIRDGERVILTLLTNGGTLSLVHHGDYLAGTAHLPVGADLVRIYRVRLDRDGS